MGTGFPVLVELLGELLAELLLEELLIELLVVVTESLLLVPEASVELDAVLPELDDEVATSELVIDVDMVLELGLEVVVIMLGGKVMEELELELEVVVITPGGIIDELELELDVPDKEDEPVLMETVRLLLKLVLLDAELELEELEELLGGPAEYTTAPAG